MMPHGDMHPYISFIQEAYKDTTIFHAYLKDMDLFIDYSRDHSVPLVVLIYPFLQDINLSREIFIPRIRNYLDEKKIQYIDVSELVEDLPVPERVINVNDSHSSSVTNQRVAAKIKPYLIHFANP